jgi:hypothetical protein
MDVLIVWKFFSSYGALGVMALVEMYAIVRLYKENNALRDRYEAKAEKSADKIALLAAKASHAADVLERRRRARPATDSDAIAGR